MTATATKPATKSGLWIRVAANLGDRRVTWRLTEMMRSAHPAVRAMGDALPVDVLRLCAEGLLVNLWGKIAEHTIDGVITEIPDTQLEDWAKWAGDPGAFAAWVRAFHFDPAAGTVRGWEECAGALQEKRVSDAERQRRKRALDKQAKELADAAAKEITFGAPSETAPIVTDGVEPIPAERMRALALALALAANKGMEENPHLEGRYNPLDAGRGDALDLVNFLHGAGLTDWEIGARIVYTIAKQYVPERVGDYIKSFKFFPERAVAMWRRYVARSAARSADPIAEVTAAEAPRTSPRNNFTVDRANRAGAGALAAADALGLDE